MYSMDDSVTIDRLLASTNLAVLATVGNGAPYCHLMVIAASDDRTQIIFITRRESAKHRQITEIPRISMLVDDRCRQGINSASALTITGTAAEVFAGERQKALEIYLKGHPELTRFANRPDQAVFRITVDRLELNHFDRGSV